METKIYSFYVLKSDINPDEIRYIGVTTQSLSRRFTQHKFCANHSEKRGLPVHKWMYSVYEKGGKINIEKIDECSESEWEDREKSLIKKYKEEGHKLLNIDEGGKGVITADKRSIDSITRSANAHKKPVTAYNLDGSKFKDFNSLTEAADFLNGKVNNITSVLSGSTKSAYGYMWKYKSEESNINSYKKDIPGIKVYQFDLEGNFIQEFQSKKEVIDYFNIKSQKALTKAITNKTAYKRYFWSMSKDVDINTFISPYKYIIKKGDIIIKVIEQKEIAEIIGISRSVVNQKLKSNMNFVYNEYFVELI